MHPPARSKSRSIIGVVIVLALHALILSALHSRIRLPGNLRNAVSIVWLAPTALEQPKPKPLKSPPAKQVLASPKPAIATIHDPHPTAIEEPAQPPAGPTEPAAPLHLDLDGMRAQAVQQEIGRKKSPVELMNESRQKNQSLEAKVEDGANQAQRPDCRTAHAGAGLFAPLMIAADLVRDKGCKL